MMDEIPFRHVPMMAWNELAIKLEPNLLQGNDWRMLAGKLSYTTEQVLFLDSRKSGDRTCTQLLLQEYLKEDASTVGRLHHALTEMGRKDAVEVLLNHMPEIEASHRNEKNRAQHSPKTPVQNSCSFGSCSPEAMYGRIPPHAHANMPLRQSGQQRPHYSVCPGYQGNNGPSPYDLGSRGVHTHPNPYFSGHFHQPMVNGHSESMTVHADHLGHSSSLNMDDIEMTDMTCRDDPVPLPQAIIRGQNNLSSFTQSMPREKMNPNIQYYQQQSEEMNAKQPLPKKRGAQIIRKMVHIPGGSHGTAVGSHGTAVGSHGTAAGSHGTVVGSHGTVVGSHGTVTGNHRTAGTHPGQSAASPPIMKLQQLANMPERFQPNQDYKNFVADQKVEEGRAGRNRPIKVEKEDYMNFGGRENHNEAAVKNGMKEKPKTFPRVKCHVAGTAEDSREANPNSLMKSTSMPVDMKPAQFRKAFRHIKVFVTYSNDNKKHLQRVLSLCNCLVKNGFSCCVDINNRYVSTLPNQRDKVNWYQEKFKESDFILVCPSQKYKNEIEAHDSNVNGPILETQLHTQYIYRLMVSEYHSLKKTSRFVPVLFEDVTDSFLPSWLHASLPYRWPNQYKDLLWMLTRPEDRIKQKLSNNSDNIPASEDE